MAEHDKGLRLVQENTAGPDEDPQFGATGFYYVTPADAWDDGYGRRTRPWVLTLPIYILRELLKGVVLATAVFSVILMAVFAGQVMRDGIGITTLLMVLPNFLPLICPFVLPLAIITGIIICYSRLAKDNEVLAASAGGINPLWLTLPAVLTSILAIFITLYMNEAAMMPAIRNIERLVIEDQANILRRMLSRPGSITVNTGGEFLAMSKTDPELSDDGKSALDITRFTIPSAQPDVSTGIWNPQYPFPAKRVVARNHAIQDFGGEAGNELVIKMAVEKPIVQDLHASDINRSFIAYGESGEERMVLGGRPSVTIHANRSSFWPILMLSRTRQEARDRIEEMESSAVPLNELPQPQQREMQQQRHRLERLILDRTGEINMRLALCFSCLAFAILGIPLGMRARGTLVTSFVIGIAVAGFYFLALKSGEMQVSNGHMPFWVIWIPDALVVLLGLGLWVTGRK
ncbi:MAG: LptF/LptG family permease [Planctomycetes bacterium]|nr:LptF/LptG family permease [Planctomycetota bacterium]